MDSKDRSEVDEIFSMGDLTTLVDLQKFLAEEVGQGPDKTADFARAFTPLTDGLGIQSVPKAGVGAPSGAGAVRAGNPTQVSVPAARTAPPPRDPAPVSSVRSALDGPVPEFHPTPSRPSEVAPVAKAPRLIIDDSVQERPQSRGAKSLHNGFTVQASPPPVPAATLGRRFLAGLVDQCFVVTALLLALAITSNAMSAAPGDLASRLLRDLGNPAFLRSAALEFAVIWLGYLALSMGLLEMTFGMWVWGLKVDFGTGGRTLKKVTRTILSFLCYPLILPTVFLILRKNGNTLIDGLTDSRVYRTTA